MARTTKPIVLNESFEAKMASLISAIGEANQSDWAETDDDKCSYIRNKPTTFPPSAHTHDDRYYTENETDTLLSSKVDVISGKGLSTNDYDDTEKGKVASAYTDVAGKITDPTSKSNGQVLTFNGTRWVAQDPTSGVTDFEALSNKPKYNGAVMSGSTDVPQVRTADWDGKYSKPATGIPLEDLASAIQASLALADSAIQSHQSLAAYRTAANQDAIDAGKINEPSSEGAANAVLITDGNGTRSWIAVINIIADESITEAKIADGAITEGKIDDLAISANKLRSYCVKTAKLDNQCVTADKIRQACITKEHFSQALRTELGI